VADWEKYVGYAEHCVSIARTLTDRDARITLREMAAEWTNLASALDRAQHAEHPRSEPDCQDGLGSRTGSLPPHHQMIPVHHLGAALIAQDQENVGR
jgi:hypothetical protein